MFRNTLVVIFSLLLITGVYFLIKNRPVPGIRFLVLSLVLFLVVFDVSIADYNKGGIYVSFFLGPTIVALGVLFFEKYQMIKHNIYPFLFAVCCGGIISIFSVSCIAIFMNAPEELIRSIIPISVTTPIAIEITKITQGIPSITAGVVIVVGIFGSAVGPAFLKGLGIKSITAMGTALGTASHGIGTARAIEEGHLPGAYSGLAMCVNGVLTTLIAPYVVIWIVGSV